jgi:hypothetical protein
MGCFGAVIFASLVDGDSTAARNLGIYWRSHSTTKGFGPVKLKISSKPRAGSGERQDSITSAPDTTTPS